MEDDKKTDEHKICCWCGKRIVPGDGFNFMLGEYSHNTCDKEYFRKQKIKIIKKDSL